MPDHRLSDLATALGARLEGDGSVVIRRAAEPREAGPDDLAMAMSPVWAEGLPHGRARAAVLWDGADWRAMGLRAALFVPRPRYAMAGITAALDPGVQIAPGVHPSAVVDPSAELGPDVAVGPLCVIEAGARIGAGSRIGPQCWVGQGAQVGPGALLVAGVRIGARVTIGARFIAQPNAVVGGDGFSFVTPERGRIEEVRATLGQVGASAPQSWVRIHSLGAVSIGDDVELGAGSCIDRGTIRDTRVGSGTKIDNLVQIGHNVVVGRDCLLCAQAGVAGSSVLGDRVVLAGHAGVADNLTVGDDAVLTAATKVLSNVPAGRVMAGYPAVAMEQHLDIYKAQRRLPRLSAAFAELQKTVKELVDKVGR
jgi:UDP-3-O-[3-hydroxymyristoyl] glucosamine N-acyltransferase